MRKTSRERVAEHLTTLGFTARDGLAVIAEDIISVHGGIHILSNDVIERWHIHNVFKDGKQTSVYSADRLVKCQRGIVVTPNSHDSDLYGDWIAEAKNNNACPTNNGQA